MTFYTNDEVSDCIPLRPLPEDAPEEIDQNKKGHLPMPYSKTTPIKNFLSDTRAVTMLTREGYETLGDIEDFTREDLDKIPGLGAVTRERIITDLEIAKNGTSSEPEREKDEDRIELTLDSITVDLLRLKARRQGKGVEELCQEWVKMEARR